MSSWHNQQGTIQGVAPLSGIPLGGLGCGTVEIRADGAIHEWQIFNNAPWSGGRLPWMPVPPSPLRPDDSLFAIRTRCGDAPAVVRVLRQRGAQEDAFTYVLPHVGSVQKIRFTGEFPFAHLEYDDPALPVQVELEAWSSFVPGDVKHSALPAALFEFHIANNTTEEIEVSLLGVMPHGGGALPGGGRQVMREVYTERQSALVFALDGIEEMHPLAGGSFVFAALSGNAQVSPRLSNHTDRSAWDAWTQGLPFAPHGPTDPCGSLLKHLAAEHADLATVYRQLPSLLRRSVEGELVPDRHIFQSRVQDDPIRYQDLGWRWALILELNLPEAIQEPFRLDMALNQSLSSSLEKVTARLQALGAETYLLAERPPFWATGREKQGLLRGAITQTRTIAPGASAHMTFLLTWFYPNHRGENVGDTLGHRYTIWFEDALDVANYVATQRDQLYRRSKAFHDAQYTATAPYWLIDAINAQLTTLSKSSWYVRDGRFAIWEGLGCCGLQTLDVAYYGSQPIALCFPELERRQLQMTADFQLTPQSPHYDEYFLAFPANRKLVQQRVAERPELALDPDLRLAMYREIVAETGLDASGRIPHFFPATFADIDSYHMIDLMPKFALLVLRDYQWTGDLEALQRLWPHVKAAMQHTRQLDALAVGLPYHYDHAPEETIISAQTYATWDFIGYSAYVSGIWLAALKATARMARIMEDQAYAAVLEQDFLRGQASMEQLLWNGEYYDLWYDPASGLRNQCCMAGQISGQFYASLLGLGDILPADHQLAALRAIFSHNRIQGRGLLNGVLPIGRRADKPKNWTLGDPRLQSDTVWSGTEYAVAVQMIQTGLVDEGLTIIREVYERYERAGQTWDHQECGGHYYRAMIVWLAWQALGGIHYAAPGQSLRLRPVAFNSEGYWKQPLVLPGFWGTCTCAQQERRCSINVQEGTLALKQLVLPGETATASAWLAGNQIEAQLAHDTLCFPQGIILTAGQTLELRW